MVADLLEESCPVGEVHGIPRHRKGQQMVVELLPVFNVKSSVTTLLLLASTPGGDQKPGKMRSCTHLPALSAA